MSQIFTSNTKEVHLAEQNVSVCGGDPNQGTQGYETDSIPVCYQWVEGDCTVTS